MSRLYFRLACTGLAVLSIALCGQRSWGIDYEFWTFDAGDLVRFNVESGQLTRIGDTGIEEIAADSYGGLGYHSKNGTMYGLFQPYREDGSAGTANLYQIDRGTGLGTRVGAVIPASTSERFSGFSISPSGRAIARTIGGGGADDSRHTFYDVNLTSGHATLLAAGTPSQFFASDLTFDVSGRLLDLSLTDGNFELRELVPETGQNQLIANIGRQVSFDAAFGYYPSDGHLYWFQNGRGFRTNPQTGATIELSGVGLNLPSGEYVGEFAPVPEPRTALLALMAFATSGLARRKNK